MKLIDGFGKLLKDLGYENVKYAHFEIDWERREIILDLQLHISNENGDFEQWEDGSLKIKEVKARIMDE